VWLTIDDGWQKNLQNVLPALEQQKVHATIFISTQAVESGAFWWTYAEKFGGLLPEKFKNNVNLLWETPETERKQVISELFGKVKDKIKREALTIDELKLLSKSEYITLGSHTVNHVITPNCTDDELMSELKGSKQKLEEWTGKKVNTFAYPNADHTEREEEFLKAAGYEIAAIVSNRFAGKNDNPYRIPRMVMGEAYFPEELCHMFGVWQKVIKKIKGSS
jgi:peptidoglycan/xylan/chitin deacetylase (PgdA/CDA1 family)